MISFKRSTREIKFLCVCDCRIVFEVTANIAVVKNREKRKKWHGEGSRAEQSNDDFSLYQTYRITVSVILIS